MEQKLVAVITGASSGIGNDIAKKLLTNNYEVIALSRTDSKDFKNFIACDVGNKESVENAFKQIGEKFGNVDLLINNAGFGQSGALEFASKEEIEKMFGVNTFGVIYCTNACLPLLKKGSKIINISSMCALTFVPFRMLYCASKSATNAISLGYRMELKNAGIDVCTVCPGEVKTNFTKNRVKIFKTNNRYGEAIKNSTQKIDAREEKGKRMGVEVVSKILLKQIKRKKMKALVIIGKKYALLNFIAKRIPTDWYLNSANAMYNKKTIK